MLTPFYCVFLPTLPEPIIFVAHYLRANDRQVRDGADETAPLVGRYCGSTLPSSYLTSSNQLWVNFKSDGSTRGSGFRATWEVGT